MGLYILLPPESLPFGPRENCQKSRNGSGIVLEFNTMPLPFLDFWRFDAGPNGQDSGGSSMSMDTTPFLIVHFIVSQFLRIFLYIFFVDDSWL